MTTALDTRGAEDAPRATPWTPFPTDLLPDPFGTFVRDTATARQCDASAVALPLLASLASAIGASRCIQIWPDWWAPSVLWCVVVCPSGSVKTPGFRAALGPLNELDRLAMRDWKDRTAEHETLMRHYERDMTAWRRGKGDQPPPEQPVPPAQTRFIVEDTTLQALAKVLSDNPRGVMLARDELSGWVRSYDQFTGSKGADVARWLEIHKAGSLRVDRAGAGHTQVPRAAVSIAGTIQDDVLPAVFGRDHQANGLLARFLIAQPPEPDRRWERGASAALPTSYAVRAAFERLLAIPAPDETEEPMAIVLSPDAEALYGDWFEVHQETKRDAEAGAWRSALSKMEEVPGRLSLVLELAGSGAPEAIGEVSAGTMERAIRLSDWFINEGRRVYSILAESEEERLDRTLLAWVERHPEGVTARHAARNLSRFQGSGACRAAEAQLHRLVLAGRLQCRPTHGVGRPTVSYYLPGPTDADEIRRPLRDPLGISSVSVANGADSEPPDRR